MQKQLKIKIFPDGKIETVTQNIKGKKCLSYIEPLEKMLDAKTYDSNFTKEYYENESVEVFNNDVEVKL